jgi:hypothetical protein
MYVLSAPQQGRTQCMWGMRMSISYLALMSRFLVYAWPWSPIHHQVVLSCKGAQYPPVLVPSSRSACRSRVGKVTLQSAVGHLEGRVCTSAPQGAAGLLRDRAVALVVVVRIVTVSDCHRQDAWGCCCRQGAECWSSRSQQRSRSTDSRLPASQPTRAHSMSSAASQRLPHACW